MEEKIKQLIEEYRLKNKIILERNPKVAHVFDWSTDSYELDYNKNFISKLERILE